MKPRSLILLLIIWAISWPSPLRAQENAHRFVTAMEAYKAENYATAIKEMESIVLSGVRNGALYYNLGNACLKENRLGHAVLWYERALRLLPNDPDLRFNANYARSLTRDASEGEIKSPLHIFFFWKYRLNHHTIIVLAVTFNLLLWGALIGRRLTGHRGWRYVAMTVAVPCAIFILTAAFNYFEDSRLRHGIVLEDKVSVRSGLAKTSTELFVLHAGAKIKVVKERGQHLQIRFGKDKIGWIDQTAIGQVGLR